MRIDKIRIKNFKGFEESIFELNPHFTVFIGDNAKGKTTILDALAVAAGAFLLGIDNEINKEARGIDKDEVRVKTIDEQPRPQLPAEIEAYGEIGNQQFSDGWKRAIKEITKKTTTTFAEAVKVKELAQKMLADSRNAGGVTFPVIAYHGTGRLWAEHEKRKSKKDSENSDEEPKRDYQKQGEGVHMAYSRCLSPKSSSKEFLSWYKTYEDEVKKFDRPNDKLWLRIFKQAIISMIPNGHWNDMAYSFAEEDLVGIFSQETDTNSLPLKFSQLSDGYRNVIGMVADIAYRCIKLNPHLGENAIKETPGIVLIDELDLHLHPKWQRRIVADLKKTFPRVQFVATTHSPFLVQSLQSDEVISLDNDIVGLNTHPELYSLEEVAEYKMGVPNPQRSKKFQDMQQAAENFYALLASNDQNKIKTAKNVYDQLACEFSDNPAYLALLKSELYHASK